MTLTGVRGAESSARASRDVIQYGKKHAGEWGFGPILDWSSAELFVYLFSRKIKLNEAYIKGKRRVGCTLCPCIPFYVAGLDRIVSEGEFENLKQVVNESYTESIPDDKERCKFVDSGMWTQRFRTDSIQINQKTGFRESYDTNGDRVYYIENERAPCRTWIRTMGGLTGTGPVDFLAFRGKTYEIRVD